MREPELKRLIDALETIGLDLGPADEIDDADALAGVVEVAARNRAAGRAKRRRDLADLRDNQAANAGGFAVDADYPETG